MELNNINNVSPNDVSTLSSAVNVNTLNATQKIDENRTKSFDVDANLNISRSDLSNSLKEFTQLISNAQSNQNVLETQVSTLNDIRELTNQLINSQSPQETESIVQPSIQQFIDKYNATAVNIQENMETFQKETDSSTYFDGKLGATPLSISEILASVEKQMSMVNQQKEFTSNEIARAKERALETIGKEVEQSAANAPFEPVDFGKDIGNFSSANINTVVGSVATSQANAIPAHSPKLLA
ncbi:MAG TPA: hypothetical protein EYG97_04665 [Arcobacter sp.]|nr:hypothetical protein [Arcobacter sp.]HIP56299.1 hypothetical protein [Arcobacter sp.]